MAITGDNVYDLIIVGAGPAGAAAGMYASRYGLRTLLLDKQQFPRDKICGDALSGKTVRSLRELDMLEEVGDLPGAFIRRVIFGSPNHDMVNVDFTTGAVENSPTGFVIRRRVFDNFLFERAAGMVSSVVQNFTVQNVVRENGQVTGVSGKHTDTGDEEEYHGRLILGADGFNSVIAKQTGLYDHDPAHWVVALRCYYENVKGLTDQIELHYVDEVLPGYFWIFPLEDGYANVGIGMLHQYIKDQGVNLREALQQTIESEAFHERFADAEPQERPTGWNLPVGSKHRKNYGDGFMLLGDAAGLIDPFTGEGIGNAMHSAKYAVQVAAEGLKAGRTDAAFLRRYDQRLWAEIGDELKVSDKLQKLGRRRFLLNFVINRAANNPEVSDIIAGMLANEVPRKRLANPLFYLKLLFS